MYSDSLTAEEYQKYGYGLRKISISSPNKLIDNEHIIGDKNNNEMTSLNVILSSPTERLISSPTKITLKNERKKANSPPAVKLFYETPEEMVNKKKVSDDYSKAIQDISTLNAKRRQQSKSRQNDIMNAKEKRVKDSWKVQEWNLYRKTYLHKTRNIEAMKHSHQRIRDMYSKASFSPIKIIESNNNTNNNKTINDIAKKGLSNLSVVPQQIKNQHNKEEPASSALGMIHTHSFVPTLPCRAEHTVPNPWSSSGLKLKNELSNDKIISPRQKRIQQFQQAVYVKQDATYIQKEDHVSSSSPPPRLKQNIDITSNKSNEKFLAIEKRKKEEQAIIKKIKQNYYRPAIKVGKLIPNFPTERKNCNNNNNPKRPQSSQHKRATYFVHHLRAKTASNNNSTKMNNSPRRMNQNNDSIIFKGTGSKMSTSNRLKIRLHVQKMNVGKYNAKYRRMYSNATSSAREVMIRKRQILSQQQNYNSNSFPSGFNNKNNVKRYGNRTTLKRENDKNNTMDNNNDGNTTAKLVPAIQISPFGGMNNVDRNSDNKNMSPVVEISHVEGEMNAKISINSPAPAKFDLSNLTGWEEV